MVDILLLQTVSIAIASAGVFAAAIYYILQLRHQTRMRQTDVVMRLLSFFGSPEFQEAWTKTMSRETEDCEKALRSWSFFKSNKRYERYHQGFNQIAVFFEEMGALLHRNLIDVSLVDDLLSSPIKMAWEKVRPIVEGVRKEENKPQYWEWFEYLYDELEKRGKRLKFGKREREGATHG